MKIRILDNAIRLRLDRSEVDAIGNGDRVESRTEFVSGAAFTYALSVSPDISEPSASFDGGTINVILPHAVSNRWATDDTEVSIRGTDGPTTILVEKDFECLDPREGEDQSNRFRNPKAAS